MHFIAWIVDAFLPDLNFNRIPTHPSDYLAWSERWQGRIAMLAITIALVAELNTKQSIWHLIGVQ